MHSTCEPPATFLIPFRILATEPALPLIISAVLPSAWCVRRRISWMILRGLKCRLQDKSLSNPTYFDPWCIFRVYIIYPLCMNKDSSVYCFEGLVTVFRRFLALLLDRTGSPTRCGLIPLFHHIKIKPSPSLPSIFFYPITVGYGGPILRTSQKCLITLNN